MCRKISEKNPRKYNVFYLLAALLQSVVVVKMEASVVVVVEEEVVALKGRVSAALEAGAAAAVDGRNREPAELSAVASPTLKNAIIQVALKSFLFNLNFFYVFVSTILIAVAAVCFVVSSTFFFSYSMCCS